jgi:hypothetical protein
MAPVKRFMGLTVDTFSFNILLVLASIIVLYILLYAQALRRTISYFEKLRFQKKNLTI